jgi:hypothetical protein
VPQDPQLFASVWRLKQWPPQQFGALAVQQPVIQQSAPWQLTPQAVQLFASVKGSLQAPLQQLKRQQVPLQPV